MVIIITKLIFTIVLPASTRYLDAAIYVRFADLFICSNDAGEIARALTHKCMASQWGHKLPLPACHTSAVFKRHENKLINTSERHICFDHTSTFYTSNNIVSNSWWIINKSHEYFPKVGVALCWQRELYFSQPARSIESRSVLIQISIVSMIKHPRL